MAKICVFCSASENLHPDYTNTAQEIGETMAKEGHHLIYGGSHRGLMGEVAKSFSNHSNEITEIIPKIFEHVAKKTHNIIVTEDFGERLKQMQSSSDAFIALPGGFGSLHEILDVTIAKQFKIHNKPIVIINTNGIYTPFIEQINKIIAEGLAPKDNDILIKTVNTPEEALEYIKNYQPITIKCKNGA